MAQNVKISMEVTEANGDKFFDATVNYYNCSPADVVKIEDKQLGVVQSLHAEAQAAVAG
jgi:hypothetical protein